MSEEGLAFKWQHAKDRITELEAELYKWLMSDCGDCHEDARDPIDSGLYESTYNKLGLPARMPEFRDAYIASQADGEVDG